MHLIPVCFAASLHEQPWHFIIVFSIAAFGFIGLMALAEMYFRYRERQQWHQTARLALEKGQPVPPLPGSDDETKDLPAPGVPLEQLSRIRRAESRRNDLKAGLILLAIGIALWLTLNGSVGHIAGGIIGGVGLALLVSLVVDIVSSRPDGST